MDEKPNGEWRAARAHLDLAEAFDERHRRVGDLVSQCAAELQSISDSLLDILERLRTMQR